MIKTAVPFLATLAEKIAPKLTSFASKTINPGTAKLVGSTIGAVSGGMAGASHASEGNKGRGFLIGAATGGALGYVGGKTLAGMTGAGPDAARLKGFASELGNITKGPAAVKTNTEFMNRMNQYVAKNWASAEHLNAIPKGQLVGSPEHRPWFGLSAQSAVQKMTEPKGSGFTRAIGNLSRNADAIINGGYGLKGTNALSRTGQVLGRDVQEAMHYTKDGFRYKRSVPGKALAASGIGFGAMEGATATNSDGTSASLPKKVLSGTTTALKWGLAPQVMGAKGLAYDIPKMLIKPEG
jgi:hypothetical protein